MVEKFYTKTGMYIDWQQIESLPEIVTLIDIGVGVYGTHDLYKVFKNANLILIDPIDEAKELIQSVRNKNATVITFLEITYAKRKTYVVFGAGNDCLASFQN